jgi:hypothetical protein
MLKYLTKFAMDILPSVLATIIGAYIVNHYIVAKPDAPAAAVASSADPKQTDVKTDPKANAKPSVSVVGGLPQPGVTAKGISEKALIEQTAAEKPAVVEKPVTAEKPTEKSADKPAETASIPVDTRRHAPAAREKVIAKFVTAPATSVVAPSTSAVAAAPVVAAPAAAPAAEAAAAPEEHRDANELARAAIERLRGDGSPRPQEAARVTEAPRTVSTAPVAAPVVSSPAVRPLPPPIMVSTPAADSFNAPTGSTHAGPSGSDDQRRPVPPADIPEASPPSFSLPSPGPLDLRAEAGEPQRREHTNVAEDMLLAAKSVFHAVLPK